MRRQIIIVGGLLLSLCCLILGLSYAIFQYSREGTKENTITSGRLSFFYDEKEAAGNGIYLVNALPMSDEDGKELSGSNSVFDFQVLATTKGSPIFYEVVLYWTDKSTDANILPASAIKTYLTEIDGVTETPVSTTVTENGTVKLYSELQDSIYFDPDSHHKVLYQEMISKNTENYQKGFRLRLWIKEDGNQVTDNQWNYSNQSFSAKVVVHAFDAGQQGKYQYTINNNEVTITGYDGMVDGALTIPSEIAGYPVTKIADSVFNRKGITELTLPKYLKEIGGYAFIHNEISSLTIPNSVEYIKGYAFSENSIQDLTFGLEEDPVMESQLIEIGFSAFNFNRLSEIHWPDTLRDFDVAPFNGQVSESPYPLYIYRLKNGVVDYTTVIGYTGRISSGDVIELPSVIEVDGVRYPLKVIGRATFYSTTDNYFSTTCEMVIPNTVERIDSIAFLNVPFEKIVIPPSVTTLSTGSLLTTSNDVVRLKQVVNQTGRSFDWKNVIAPIQYRIVSSEFETNDGGITGIVTIHFAGGYTQQVEIVNES